MRDSNNRLAGRFVLTFFPLSSVATKAVFESRACLREACYASDSKIQNHSFELDSDFFFVFTPTSKSMCAYTFMQDQYWSCMNAALHLSLVNFRRRRKHADIVGGTKGQKKSRIKQAL